MTVVTVILQGSAAWWRCDRYWMA